MGEKEYTGKFGEKVSCRSPLGKQRKKLEDKIKVVLSEIGCGVGRGGTSSESSVLAVLSLQIHVTRGSSRFSLCSFLDITFQNEFKKQIHVHGIFYSVATV
jgi:hypothetical protein